MIRIADLRCVGCGTADIGMVDPGDDEVRDLFLLKRGRPVTARCLACWVASVKQDGGPPPFNSRQRTTAKARVSTHVTPATDHGTCDGQIVGWGKEVAITLATRASEATS